jgi:hypothetical protein
MSNKRKVALVVVGALLVCAIMVGISYAFWTSTSTQSTTNNIFTSCLKIEMADSGDSAISLQNAYPLTDTEAESLTPYTFTVTNKCSNSIMYDLSLEIMEVKDTEGNDKTLDSQYVATSFNGGVKKLLSNYDSITPTYSDSDYTASEARSLATNVSIEAKATETYTLKVWLNDSVTISDPVQNKTFISKINVTAHQTVEDTETTSSES